MDLVEQNRICYEMPPGSDARQYQNGPPRLIAKYDRKGVEPQLRWRSLELQVRVKAHHPVKPRPPTARRFYFTELAVPLVYIFVSSHVLANVTNAAPAPGYRRDPPRRFVFSSSAAPTAPPGSALLASPGPIVP